MRASAIAQQVDCVLIAANKAAHSSQCFAERADAQQSLIFHVAKFAGAASVIAEDSESILENDPAGKVRRVLEQEVAFTRRKLDAAARAKEAASRGEHHIALDILQGTFDDAERVLLPWNIETTPPGVRVTIERHGRSGDTETRMTPFTLEGTFADVWTLRFDLEGFDSRALVVRGPQDIDLALSRTPAVHFDLGGRVDAIPAPVGDGSTGEYIVCDRKGAIARMAWGGEMSRNYRYVVNPFG